MPYASSQIADGFNPLSKYHYFSISYYLFSNTISHFYRVLLIHKETLHCGLQAFGSKRRLIGPANKILILDREPGPRITNITRQSVAS
jgi:hypothetical protein